MHDIYPRTIKRCSGTPLDHLDKPVRSAKQHNSKRHPTVIRKATGMYFKCGCPQNVGETICPKPCACTELTDEDNRFIAPPLSVVNALI